MKRIHLLSLPALLTLCACGSVPTQRFEFDAIDTGETPRPCLVVVDDDWVGAAEKNQFVNVAADDTLALELQFNSAEVEITVAPVLVEAGKVSRVPKSRKEARDYSGFMDETRRLMLRDPKRQLFILPRKSGNS
jgi:hypothetical protein